jgi:WhiB family redox-sensing transcriptional regulator
MDTEYFFPVAEADPQTDQVHQARVVCRACPVQAECLTEALAARDVHGIRAGLTGGQRAALLRSSHLASDAAVTGAARGRTERPDPGEHRGVRWGTMDGPAESIEGHRPAGHLPSARRAGEHTDLTPRRQAAYYCPAGHETRLTLAAEAKASETWTCRTCGAPAGTDPQKPPPPAAPTSTQGNPLRTNRTPIEFVRERRSEDELHALLDEALAKLHAHR